MKTIVFYIVLSGLEALVQGEIMSTFIKEGQYAAELVEELWPRPNDFGMNHYQFAKSPVKIQEEKNRARAFQPNLVTTFNNYLTGSLQRSVESLLDWDQIVRWGKLNTASQQEGKGRIKGYFAAMKLKKELIFLLLVIIMKMLGVFITKLNIAFGMVFLKLVIAKIVFLFMHLKNAKYHGPLIKAYQTTTNEFHSHLGHHDHHDYGNEEPFFPSPPHFHDHSERK